jgi:predicted nucleic acid-binding protein
LPEIPIGISTVTYSELLHGWHRASEARIRARRRVFIDDVLREVQLIPFGGAEAEKHSEIWATLDSAGTPIGAHDLLIAATALSRGDALATLNHEEFARIPNLTLSDVQRFTLA